MILHFDPALDPRVRGTLHPEFLLNDSRVRATIDHFYPGPFTAIAIVGSFDSIRWKRQPGVRATTIRSGSWRGRYGGQPGVAFNKLIFGVDHDQPFRSIRPGVIAGAGRHRSVAATSAVAIRSHEAWHQLELGDDVLQRLEPAISDGLGMEYTQERHRTAAPGDPLLYRIAEVQSRYAAGVDRDGMPFRSGAHLEELMAEVFCELVSSNAPRDFALSMRSAIDALVGRDSRAAILRRESQRERFLDRAANGELGPRALGRLSTLLGTDVTRVDGQDRERLIVDGWNASPTRPFDLEVFHPRPSESPWRSPSGQIVWPSAADLRGDNEIQRRLRVLTAQREYGSEAPNYVRPRPWQSVQRTQSPNRALRLGASIDRARCDRDAADAATLFTPHERDVSDATTSSRDDRVREPRLQPEFGGEFSQTDRVERVPLDVSRLRTRHVDRGPTELQFPTL